MSMHTITALLWALVAAGPAAAQWTKMPDRSIPRTAAGEPDLAAPAPKAAHGKPGPVGRLDA